MPSFEGFPGTSNWEETLESTQNLWRGLHISSGLGMPWDSTGGAGKHLGEEHLEYPAIKWMDGWNIARH